MGNAPSSAVPGLDPPGCAGTPGKGMEPWGRGWIPPGTPGRGWIPPETPWKGMDPPWGTQQLRTRRSLPEGFSWGPFQGSIHSEPASPGRVWLPISCLAPCVQTPGTG
uniref:Zinc finger protein ZFPM1/2 PR domain-containing protein n=1 Tax=Ficedula albicollis TaxID=59894 RepID=A0A803V571_FICAL